MTGAILAQKPGRCPACRGAIRPGDLIEEGGGSWYHDACLPIEFVRAQEEEGSVVPHPDSPAANGGAW